MDLLEGTRAGALLLDARDAGRLAHHAALSDEEDMAVGELLLELAGEATLDLVESLELGDGDEDDDGLLASLDVNLARGRDLERAELSLEVGDAVLEVEDSLSDEELSRVGRSLGRVGGAEDLGGGRLNNTTRVSFPRFGTRVAVGICWVTGWVELADVSVGEGGLGGLRFGGGANLLQPAQPTTARKGRRQLERGCREGCVEPGSGMCGGENVGLTILKRCRTGSKQPCSPQRRTLPGSSPAQPEPARPRPQLGPSLRGHTQQRTGPPPLAPRQYEQQLRLISTRMTTISRASSPGGRPDGGLGLTSPPGPGRISRRTADVSSIAGPSPSLNGAAKKPRAGRNRLRDYYGLAGAPLKGDPMDPGQLSPLGRSCRQWGSPADRFSRNQTDSSAFNPDTYFDYLANNASLPDLLKRENELLTGKPTLVVLAMVAPAHADAVRPHPSLQKSANSTANGSHSYTTTTMS